MTATAFRARPGVFEALRAEGGRKDASLEFAVHADAQSPTSKQDSGHRGPIARSGSSEKRVVVKG